MSTKTQAAPKTSEKLNVENLPLTIDNKIEMVPKRQYCNHKASSLQIRHKIQVSKAQISDLIDMAVNGKELEAGNEPIWNDIYQEVKDDIDLAQDKNREAIEAANAKAEEEKKAKDEKEANEKRLVSVAVGADVAATFASLSDNFDLGNMDRCVPKEGTTDDQIISALVTGLKMDNFSNWAKGDLVAELDKRGHESAMVILCEQTGIPYKSIYRMAVTARNVPPDKRDPNVSFTTYAEVANARLSKDETENRKLLNQTLDKIAPKEKTGDAKKDEVTNAGKIVTAQDARKAIQEAQGKEPPVKPDKNAVDLAKDTFVIVNWEDHSLSACLGFPASLADTEGVDILHARTFRRAYQGGKKFSALDVHKEPAKEGATPAKPAKKKAAKKK